MKKMIFLVPVVLLSFLPVGCGNSSGSTSGVGPSTSYSKTGNFTPADNSYFAGCELKGSFTVGDKTEFAFHPSTLKILSVSTEDLMGCPSSVLLTGAPNADGKNNLVWIANFDESDDFTNENGQKTRTCEYNYLQDQNNDGFAIFNSYRCTKKVVQ